MQPPFLPDNATWIGALLLVLAGLFLAALVIGCVARVVMPERYIDEGDGAGNHSLEAEEDVLPSEATA
ncbi:MAG: hypothetical protein ACTHM6_16930 [Tepidisphaeraceae bacterium]